MKTYRDTRNTWVAELKVGQVLCICEANKRSEARRGALEMAKRRAGK